MKVGDLVQVKRAHQREFKAVAENRGYPVMPIIGLIMSIESNGHIQLDNRPMPAMAHYFEVISESR
jgi:hypothetical protein|tara:strand:- start:6 stop:203 length:198 start_codon:yes stop_codon:yes gene_type:complete